MSSIEDILNADNDSDQEENAVGTGVDLDALLGSESDSDEDSMKVGAPVVVKAPTLSTTKHITAPIPTRIDYVEGRAFKTKAGGSAISNSNSPLPPSQPSHASQMNPLTPPLPSSSVAGGSPSSSSGVTTTADLDSPATKAFAPSNTK